MPNTRKRSRNSKNFVAIPFDVNVALGALANTLIVKTGLTSGFTQNLYIMSVDLAGIITGLTAGEGDPLELGLAHSDYSVTEILENTDVQFLGPGNKIEQEQSRRLVRKVAEGYSDLASDTTIMFIGRFGSRIIRTKIKFVCQDTKKLDVWVKNRSGSTLTTGASLRASGTIYGRWIL